ncbi:MAG: leucine-rich repeat protein [Bacteroidaceae bacterium]|nr:leucine-rich repeat protein [Bacteroidaceae bacterium]
MKTINTLCTLLCVMLLTAQPATAQNTTDNKNKAIIETTDGDQELNTDDIQVIRFDGGKITVVQPWGDTTFDRTLRTLSFQRPNPGTLRLTVSTSIGSDNSQSGPRRAQAIDSDGKLKSTWENGDVVYVYTDNNPDNDSPIGTLTPKTYGEKTATLSGNINAKGLTDGQTLYFSTKDRSTLDLSSQDGTVESLFYFTATGTLTIDGGNASISNLNFERPIAVVKFTLKDKGNSDAAISAKSFTVYYGTNSYVVTPTTATNELFVGIPGISSQTVTLTATDGNEYYLYQRTGVTFADNSYYAINVKMEASDLARPLTFEAKKANVQVSFTKSTDTSLSSLSVEYSTDGATWKTYTDPITLTNVGDKVSFRGTNVRYANSTSDGKYSYFFCSDDCYVYGNIMSLINKNSFATTTTLTANYTFAQLFTGNTNIFNHSTKALVLPATTLYNLCYYGMFNGCTSLTTAPALPATTLASQCYSNMFDGCTSLTTAPALPATTLAGGCYSQMFQGCTSLKTAPANLPATTLVTHCYSQMFQGCTSLKTAPANLPATTLATHCYYRMFSGCTSLTTAPALPTTTLVDHCYYGMFDGCTNLTTAPTLPATTLTLADQCYSYMFRGCTSLQTAPALPATTLTTQCYSNMFDGCTSLTTAPSLPATTLATQCYQDMFKGCTSLTTAPTLPAPTLASHCYAGMFSGCTNLNSVTCLATNISANSCTKNWLNGVAATGTFFRPESMTSWTTNSADGIPSGWTAKDVALLTPLTFEAKTAGAMVTFTINTTAATNGVEYSTDGITWNSYTSGTAITLTKEGDKVSFRGTNATYAQGIDKYSTFSCTEDCYVYGNIMSLISKTGYATTTTLTGESAFCKLFNGNTHIVSHSSETLLLPATTLTINCYSCMFEGCTNLTTAPALPATTLAESCYSNMFNGCTSLTTAPDLPAATLTGGCYFNMFIGCISLSSVTCLATNISAEKCTTNWLGVVAKTGTFTKAASMNSWGEGASGIPSGWTIVNAQ